MKLIRPAEDRCRKRDATSPITSPVTFCSHRCETTRTSHTHMKRSSDSLRTRTSRRRWMRAISTSISSGDTVLSAMDTSEWPASETEPQCYGKETETSRPSFPPTHTLVSSSDVVNTESAHSTLQSKKKRSSSWFWLTANLRVFSFLGSFAMTSGDVALFMWRVSSHSRDGWDFRREQQDVFFFFF